MIDIGDTKMNLSNQEKIAVIVLLLFIITGLGILLYKNYYSPEPIEMMAHIEPNEENKPQILEKTPIIVHIAGAVKNSGVYQLKDKDRVIDAIKMAGGEIEEANLDAINLAAFIYDGQKIIVPFRPSQDPEKQDRNSVFNLNESNYPGDTNYSSSPKININIVDAAALQCLPGIGPVLSERIISFRNQNGCFENIDCIKEVSGIGDKKFEGIKDLICVH